jgi:phage shock protein C
VNSPRTSLYRDKQNAKLLGVCAGISDYTGVNVFWIRLGVFLSLFALGPITLAAYFFSGFFLNKKPAHLYVEHDEQKYWQRVRQNPARTAREVRARFRDIDRRLADVETYYVTSNPRLSAEIERLR